MRSLKVPGKKKREQRASQGEQCILYNQKKRNIKFRPTDFSAALSITSGYLDTIALVIDQSMSPPDSTLKLFCHKKSKDSEVRKMSSMPTDKNV